MHTLPGVHLAKPSQSLPDKECTACARVQLGRSMLVLQEHSVALVAHAVHPLLTVLTCHQCDHSTIALYSAAKHADTSAHTASSHCVTTQQHSPPHCL